MRKRIWRWLRRWLECRTKRCDYYQHYLAYGPPELTHEGYHAATRKCIEAQKHLSDWYDQHPTGQAPRHLMQFASDWEARVRA